MTTCHGVTEQAATAAIDSATRVLRLPTIRSRFEEIAAAAQREQLTYLGFLAELVMAECDDRDRRRAARRIHDAGFSRDKRIDDFDFTANLSVNPAVIHQLATCAWVKAGHPLCLIGDSGTGKSHLLIGLGTAAAEAGYRVRYTLASKLVNELAEAADDKQLSRTINRYGRVDLLCLDELGYMELDRRGAELLFQVLTEREERSAIAIASNEPFSGWTKTFTDPSCAPPLSTGSPSPGRSSRPAPPATGSPTHAPPGETTSQTVARTRHDAVMHDWPAHTGEFSSPPGWSPLSRRQSRLSRWRKLVVMLDPAVCDDVIVTVAHPWGDIEAPLPTWIETGPGPRPLVTISKARRRDGSPVPLEEIPLQYRNTAESRRLQRLGLLPAPWGPPPDEPESATRPDDER